MGALDFSLPVFENGTYQRLTVEIERQQANTMWITMKPAAGGGVHNFSLPLLHDLHALVQRFGDTGARWFHAGELVPVQYAVMRSGQPGVFNAGGDLKYFRACIANRNREGLYRYAMLSLDVLLGWTACSSAHGTTIALVEGRALGGGFEAALGADHIIAEEQSTFGFPEIMFGLFPCTGAMSLLAQRVSPRQAERIIGDGKIYGARELLEMGVIDAVCAAGQGRQAVQSFIAAHGKRRLAHLAIKGHRQALAPLCRADLRAVVDEWVALAMSLGPAELRVMEMLILMQEGATRTGGKPLSLVPASA